MTQDQYKNLGPGERMIYDECLDFSNKLLMRLDALTKVTQALLAEATREP